MLCTLPGTWPAISTSEMQLQPSLPCRTLCHTLGSPGLHPASKSCPPTLVSSHFIGSDRPPYGPRMATGPRLESSGGSHAHPGSQLCSCISHRNGCYSPRPPPKPASELKLVSCQAQLHTLLSPCGGYEPTRGLRTCVPPLLPTTRKAPRELELLMCRPSRGPIQVFTWSLCISMPARVSTRHVCVGVCARCVRVTVDVVCHHLGVSASAPREKAHVL